jgi:D-alanyl-D-alanine carboxypeptidase (penicillin-binding protein 5/6)
MGLFCRRATALAVVVVCLFVVLPVAGSAQAVEQPDIVAANAIVVDASTGDILLDKHSGDPVAMASLTKLFTAFVAIETTPLERQMIVSDYDLVGEASMGILAGETLSFQTLLHGMLLPSGNDAATAIARNLGAQPGDSDNQAAQRFIDRANTRLTTLGLHNTHLVNPHGLDADGHYSTARDIAAVTLFALDHEPTFAATLHTAEYEAEGHAITNTNRLLGVYDGLIGGKTGVTDNAGYCLMQVAERNGQRVIIVLLGSTPDAWYDDAKALLDYGFAATAMPGAATRYGQITFSTAPAIAVPASQALDGLAVSDAGLGASLVSQTDITMTTRRSPWLWIVSAAVLAPASLLMLSQLQRGLNRRAARTPRHNRASVAAQYEGQVACYDTDLVGQAYRSASTEPALWENVAPDYRFDETTEWRVAAPQPGRRDDRPRYPVLSPAYGGD